MTHPNRSMPKRAPQASDGLFDCVIYLPTVGRLWKHHQADSEAIFSSAHNARRVVEGFSRAKGGEPKEPSPALVGAKVMRVIRAAGLSTEPPEPGAILNSGWWLIEA